MLILLLLATVVAADHSDVNIQEQRGQYWGDRGLANPSRRLRELADWSLLYWNSSAGPRPVLLFTIATPASVSTVLPRLLENLAMFKSQDQMDTLGKTMTSLAEHTLVASTNLETQRGCDSLQEKYHHKCYELDHGYNGDVQDLLQLSRTKAHAYSLGLSRIKSMVDLVSLGYDVFYFDLQHYFFKNPLQYMYQHTTAPVVVSTPQSGCQLSAPQPDGSLPGDHHRLDVAFFRSNPATFRCLYNWLYWSCHTAHDVNDKPLDHFTFRNVMQECVSALTPSVIRVEYLSPEHFPSACATKCGCQAANAVQPDANGVCSKEAMSSWVGYLFSCSNNVGELDSMITKYTDMYKNAGLTITR